MGKTLTNTELSVAAGGVDQSEDSNGGSDNVVDQLMSIFDLCTLDRVFEDLHSLNDLPGSLVNCAGCWMRYSEYIFLISYQITLYFTPKRLCFNVGDSVT